jgi:hypothetical protein
MKKIISCLLIVSTLSACSTAGGWYKKDDPIDGELSPIRSVFGVVGVAAVVAGAVYGIKESTKGGGNNYSASRGYARDYQPGNGQWVCRDKANGQYASEAKCSGQSYIDNWP